MKLIEIEYSIKSEDRYRSCEKKKISINVEDIIGIEKGERSSYSGEKIEETILYIREIGKLLIDESYQKFLKRLKGEKLNRYDVIANDKN